ncbi:ThuA domain-containing protein [Devosia sp.]|uniref:ThuA domain-containing protein n=1 Tax=Devosia sp. TaxID=1871048 RepID=UPI0032651D23
MRKAIIVWGGCAGHEPEQCAQIIGDRLAREGFAVEVTNDFDIFAAPALADAALLVPIITGETLPDGHANHLMQMVREGLGLGGFHACLTTSFKDSGAFHYLTGVSWVSLPGDIIDYRVQITRPDDPLVAGISDFEYRSEQYYLHYDPSIDILASTRFSGAHDPVTTDVVMPVAFKRRFGQGRIFYSALGHVASELAHPQAAEMLRRGLNWVAR